MNTTTEIAMDRTSMLICKSSESLTLVEAVELYTAMQSDLAEDAAAGLPVHAETAAICERARLRAIALCK
jgi:hypothetical protein